jgi:hypothetical protein
MGHSPDRLSISELNRTKTSSTRAARLTVFSSPLRSGGEWSAGSSGRWNRRHPRTTRDDKGAHLPHARVRQA